MKTNYTKNNLEKQAFSLIELMISMIFIMCVTACFMPVITKKLTKMTLSARRTLMTNCTKFDTECVLCTKSECTICTKTCVGKVLDFKKCKCN